MARPDVHPATRFDALDAWRGVCAVLVALYHLPVGWSLGDWAVVRNGFLFVDFFFVLSGFVISHAYGERLSGGRAYGAFLIRRFGRVWPLHAAVLVAFAAVEAVKLAVLADPAGGERTSVFAFVTNLTLVHGLGLHGTLTWNPLSWSISVEFWVYVLFGLAVLAGGRWRVGLTAAAGVAGVAVLAAFSPHGMDATYDYGLFRCLYGFAVGCGTYALWRRTPRRPIPAPVRKGAATVLEGVAVAAAVLFVANTGHSPANTSRTALAAPLVFAGVVWVFAHEAGAVSRALTTPAPQYLGAISYGIYIIHGLLLYVVTNAIGLSARWGGKSGGVVAAHGPTGDATGDALAGDALAIAYAAAVIALAALAARLVEGPGRRAFNRLAIAHERRGVTADAYP